MIHAQNVLVQHQRIHILKAKSIALLRHRLTKQWHYHPTNPLNNHLQVTTREVTMEVTMEVTSTWR